MSYENKDNEIERSSIIPQQIIEKAMTFPFDNILRKYSKENSFPLDLAKEHERELKRFLILVSKNPSNYEMRGGIDKLWHTFITFTRDYFTFCNEIAGHYIHHEPGEGMDTQNNEKYEKFLTDYEKLFGEEPPVQHWPRPFSSMTEMANCQPIRCMACHCGDN